MYVAKPIAGSSFGYHFGAAKKKAPPKKATGIAFNANVARLQRALVDLGAKVGDKSLKIATDGKAGPNTAKATNRAFTTHIGPGQAPAQFRTGRLTPAQIIASAATMSDIVYNEISRRTGAASSKYIDAVQAALQKRTAPGTAPASTSSKGGFLPKSIAAIKSITAQVTKLTPAAAAAFYPGLSKKGSPAVAQMQTFIQQLGSLVGDSALSVGPQGADGIVGKNTTSAANVALARYATTAPKSMRTGKLSASAISSSATQIGGYLMAEIQRRGQRPMAPTPEAAAAAQAIQNVQEAAAASVASIAPEGTPLPTPPSPLMPMPDSVPSPAPTPGGEQPAEQPGAEATPSDNKKWWIIGGVGAALLVGGVAYTMSKHKFSSNRTLQPRSA